MTKEEYQIARDKATKYQSLEHELDKVDDALKDIKKYSHIALDTSTNAPRVSIGINTDIREDLVTLLQNYREWIAGQMEAL